MGAHPIGIIKEKSILRTKVSDSFQTNFWPLLGGFISDSGQILCSSKSALNELYMPPLLLISSGKEKGTSLFSKNTNLENYKISKFAESLFWKSGIFRKKACTMNAKLFEWNYIEEARRFISKDKALLSPPRHQYEYR